MTVQDDVDEADTILYTPEESDDEQFNMAIDDTSKDLTIVMGKLVTTTFVLANVPVPTKKVGCSYVTNQLKEFLNHFPPESREKAFEKIYEILQVLDAYLIDNPQQHTCLWGQEELHQSSPAMPSGVHRIGGHPASSGSHVKVMEPDSNPEGLGPL